jgi:hypothetical protein
VTGPSLRFITAHLIGDMPTTRTEYIRGLNTRSESRSCSGHSDTTPATNVRYEYGPLRAHIYNRDLNYHFDLELAARIYTAYQVNEYGSPKWTKPHQTELPQRSGRTIRTHTETIDTGERREIFHCIARRVVTRTLQTRDEQLVNESECDGWYIDPPSAWLTLYPPKPGTLHHLCFGTGERDDYKFTEVGKRETGLALLSTRRHKSFFQDETGRLREHEAVDREEITEFSESPLPADLFVPPSDFKRVPQLPDGLRYTRAYLFLPDCQGFY